MRQAILCGFVLWVAVGCGSQAPPPALPTVKLPVRGPGIHQESVQLPRYGKLLYTISVPEDLKPGAPLVLALHYGGEVTPYYGRGLIEGLVGPGLAGLGAVIVAPDARGGQDWTAADNEQAAVWLTRSIAESYGTDPRKTVVTGFSMGGIGAWHLGSRHPQVFTAAIPVAGKPVGKPDWTIPLFVIHSSADEVFPIAPVRSYVNGLKAKGVKVEFLEVPRLTHYETDQFSAPLARAADWLVETWK